MKGGTEKKNYMHIKCLNNRQTFCNLEKKKLLFSKEENFNYSSASLNKLQSSDWDKDRSDPCLNCRGGNRWHNLSTILFNENQK